MYALLADGAARQHDLDGLQTYAPLAEESAARYDHKLYMAIGHRAQGVLHRLTGDFSQAERRLSAALDLFKELGTRWQVGRTLSELGHLAIEQSNTDKARACYSQALSLFGELDARPDANQARSRLASLTAG